MKNLISTFLALIVLGINVVAQPTETTYQGNVIKAGYVDQAVYGPFNIGFNFTFFNNSYSQFYLNDNGQVFFSSDPANLTYIASSIPDATAPNNFIAAFWDDLLVDATGKILYKTIGAAPNRKLVIQFTNMGFFGAPAFMGTFTVVLNETSNIIKVQYRIIVDNTSARAKGESATIGIENSDGTAGIQYAFHNAAAVTTGKALLYTPSGSTYTLNQDAIYEGIYLTSNLTLPEPGIPALLSPPQNSVIGSDFTFSWADAGNAASYSLLISSSPDLAGASYYTAGSNTSYNVTGLTLDETFYWGVFATNATGTTWCEIKKFTTSSTPPLAAVPQTNWVELNQEKTLKLQYTGGDASAKTAIVTSLPAQGQLYQYNAGAKGTLITTVPTTVTDPGKNVIYVASGTSGNNAGNFNFKIHDANGDSPDALVTINVSPSGVPNLLYTAKNTGVELQFDVMMADPTGKQNQFSVKVNGAAVTPLSASLKPGDQNTILLSLPTALAGTETVLVSYTQGNVNAFSGAPLFTFTDQAVTLLAQTITFPALPLKQVGDPNFNPGATSGSGLGITYSSSNLPVAVITANMVSILSTGSSYITARQAGNVTYAPARYVRTLAVGVANQTIAFNPIPTVIVGDPDFTLNAVASSGLTVSFSSSNPAVATVTGNLVHIVSAGSTVITASQAGNSNFNPAPNVLRTLTVDLSTGLKDIVIPQMEFNIYLSGYAINIKPLNDNWDGKVGSVSLINIIGTKVSSLQNTEFYKNSIIQINAPSVKGIYIVEIKSGNMRYVGKVMIR
jgi:hypothetical protein